MQVLTDLKQRGVSDILICCVDGLTGFPEAIEAIFPKTTVQTCIVHYADPLVMPTGAAESVGVGGSGQFLSA
jgi:transposase-like protein